MSLNSLDAPFYLVQSDTENEWFSAKPDQVEAIKEGYRRGQLELKGGQGGSSMWLTTDEYTYKITTRSRTKYLVYWRKPGKIYIGQPNGKKRAVIYIPTHKGAAAAHKNPTAQEIGCRVTSIGYTL